MTARPFIPVLLTLALATSGPAAERPSLPTVAVVIEADDDAQSNQIAVAAGGLTHALVNYCDYVMYNRGREFDIIVATDNANSHLQIERLTDRYDVVVHLVGRGRYLSRTIIWSDHRRNHHRLKINGFAQIEIDYEYLTKRDNSTISIHSGRVRERAERYWQELPLSLRNRTADSIVTFNPEPLGYIVQRAVSRALFRVEPNAVSKKHRDGDLPVRVLVDSIYLAGCGDDWRDHVVTMVDVASRALQRQFARGLNLVSLQSRPPAIDSGMTFQQAYRRLARSAPDFGDTLVVVLTGHAARVGLVPQHQREAVGRSELGSGLVLLDGHPFPHPRSQTWRLFENGLTLLHEIGHSLGAIHVADFTSVMNPNSNWIASDRFDPLNESIVAAALDGRLKLNRPTDYLAILSQLLQNSDYHLAEYPTFFHDFLSYRGNRAHRESLRAAIDHDSYLTAADGYGWLKKGYISKAAEHFKQAIAVDSTQAALYFYLSQVTRGEEAEQALQKAADMGHSDAQSRLGARLVEQ